jgi:hypothetical protein
MASISELIPQETNRLCLVCGRQGVIRGAFAPDHPETYGGYDLIFYRLCEMCLQRPDIVGIAEAIIAFRLGGEECPQCLLI